MLDTLTTIFSDYHFGQLLGLGTAATLVAWLIIWYRSKSTYLPLRSFLARFAGLKSNDATVLGKHLHEHEAYVIWVTKTGVRHARTPSQAKRIAKWTTDNDENVEDVAACGTFFNCTDIGPNKNLPPKWSARSALALAMVFFLFTAFTGVLVAVDGAVVQANQTSHWFVLWKDKFKPVLGASVPIEQCKEKSEDLAKEKNLSPVDVAAVCKYAADPKYATHIDASVIDQRFAFSPAVFAFSCMLLMFLRYGTQVFAAHDMTDRLAARKASAPKRNTKPRTAAVNKKAKATTTTGSRSKQASMQKKSASQDQA
ncbi:MAG TPA: DUF6216 family protein [Noviherbaspirillum sp.]